MFEKSLLDVVKGIRAHPHNEAEYVATCIAEIRDELKSPSPALKAAAIQKLTYLQMSGYDFQWASFHCVDVMSQPRFKDKRIGFVAAAQSFNDSTDVMLLTTNLFRKAFASSTCECSLAMGCLAKIATPDLSRDLLGDAITMLSSSRPLFRKKAVICVYKLLKRLPEALPTAFPRLRERLDDPDPSVVAATVNVLTELAAENPTGYLGLAPALYKVLTTSSSNWTLIKVVKFMRQLVPHEPRLGRKLVEPLTRLIETSSAKSLQFECLYTIASTMAQAHPETAKLAAARLKEFVENEDQNLKYLGLLALAQLQASDKDLVHGCSEAVLKCLEDNDVSVRSQALSLVAGMVTRANLAPLVSKLMSLLDSPQPSHHDEVVQVVIAACRRDGFAHVPSFRWLVSTLLELGQRAGPSHSAAVSELLMEVALRVPSVQPFAAGKACELLVTAANSHYACPPPAAALQASAWILGEHSALLPVESQRALLYALVQRGASTLPPIVQNSFLQGRTHELEGASSSEQSLLIYFCDMALQALIRVFTQLPDVAAVATTAVMITEGNMLGIEDSPSPYEDVHGSGATATEEASARVGEILSQLLNALAHFLHSEHIEVLERALAIHRVLSMLAEEHVHGRLPTPIAALRNALAPGLKAVAPKAQRRVKLPEGLDLHTPIHMPEAEADPQLTEDAHDTDALQRSSAWAPAEASGTTMKTPPRAPQAHGIYYLPRDTPTSTHEEAPAEVQQAAPIPNGRKALHEGSFHEEWEDEPSPVVLTVEGEDLPSPHEDDERPVLPKHKQRRHRHSAQQGGAPDLMQLEPAGETDPSRRKHRRRKHKSEKSVPADLEHMIADI